MFELRDHYRLMGRWVPADELRGLDPAALLGTPWWCLVQNSPFEGDRRTAGGMWYSPSNVRVLPVRDVFEDGVGRPDGSFDVYRAEGTREGLLRFVLEANRKAAAEARSRLEDALEAAGDAEDQDEDDPHGLRAPTQGRWARFEAVRAREALACIVEDARPFEAAMDEGEKAAADGIPAGLPLPIGTRAWRIARTEDGAVLGRVEDVVVGLGLRSGRLVLHFETADAVPIQDVFESAGALDRILSLPVMSPEDHKKAMDEEESARWTGIFEGLEP